MERLWLCFPRCRFSRVMVFLQIVLGCFLILVSITALHRFYSTGLLLATPTDPDACRRFHSLQEGYTDFDLKTLSDRVEDAVAKLAELQEKLEATVQKIDKARKDPKANKNITQSEFRRFLDEDVIQPLYGAHIALRLVRIPKPDPKADPNSPLEEPLINYFTNEEIRKYITVKTSRNGTKGVYGTKKAYNTIGHACVLMRKELEEYMDYDIGSYCKDDWNLAHKLMLGGCDPLPRRRCLARASRLYQRPLPINESMWTLPDGRNVRWSNLYRCRDYKCLSSRNPRRGFSKCTSCFQLEKERLKWVANASTVDFPISDVLAVKPGEVRIGLDVSIGTGSFAARMREWNVTIVSTAMNLGAPFSETIALRGLVPLYASLSQRLPFFDNTMDLIHTSVLLDGWIDLQLLDFILFDWDRVLRPGGLLWVDKFFCSRKDLDDYMYMFLQFRYKKHKWVISFKSKEEVYLSALLEKPARSL